MTIDEITRIGAVLQRAGDDLRAEPPSEARERALEALDELLDELAATYVAAKRATALDRVLPGGVA